ncbi:hypothetical protein [Microbulbifer sp. THAF38]|uniref:hypothetical protein n=1 Tax=Microbulbifer sp. THAF38 TaxID=2587856 RepID=UPI00126916E2|nr:hypothetical protein [Microbulbifer sp. THAF38]QFT56582.1 hypothetical protein FIU95_18705 [Microbulbifer sp. THAF38]
MVLPYPEYTFFTYLAFLLGWNVELLEVLLGFILANFPLPFIVRWCERMASDLRGYWINFIPYISPLLVGLGGTAVYIHAVLQGEQVFWLYLTVPMAQATAFWVLLALVFCIYPFINTDKEENREMKLNDSEENSIEGTVKQQEKSGEIA